jgi:hypothetical protein
MLAVLQSTAAIKDIQLLEMFGENVRIMECGLGINPYAKYCVNLFSIRKTDIELVMASPSVQLLITFARMGMN